MATHIQDPLSSGRSIWLRVIAWFFKLGGSLFALMALFSLVALVFDWPASAGHPSNAVMLLLFSVMAGALIATGVLLARRARAGALLAVILSLYPFAFVLIGSRPLSWLDIASSLITVAVIASIWPELSSQGESTRVK
jgi:hypothetical protein